MLMLYALRDKLLNLYDPISTALLPIVSGLLRRSMLELGAQEHEVRLHDQVVHYFRIPARTWPYGGEHHRDAPLLLVHGLGDDATTWGLVLYALAADRDVYAVDLPGYGLSGLPRGRTHQSIAEMAQVIEVFVREVIGRPAIVAGNSMGGWLAIRMAQHTPELLQAIILINAGGAMLGGRESWNPFIETVDVPDLQTARKATRQVFGRIPPIVLDVSLRSFQNLFRRNVVRAFVSAATEQDFLTPDDLHSVRTPTLIIWGMQDQFLPPGSLEFFRVNLPDAQVHELGHCGHLPQRERPRSLVRAMRGFVAQVRDDHNIVTPPSKLSAAVLQ